MDREAIKIANWNACSLTNKHRELLDFLNTKEVDIAIITETHLKPELNVFLPDFRLVRLDRTCSGGGGVAIAARRNISCRLLPNFQLKTIEAIGVEVSTSLGPITIIAAYCPKQTHIRDGSSVAFRKDIIKLTRRSGNFHRFRSTINGPLAPPLGILQLSKWLCQIENWNACSLLDFINAKEIDIAVITETHLKPEVNIYLSDFRLSKADSTSARVEGVAVAVAGKIHHRWRPECQTSSLGQLSAQSKRHHPEQRSAGSTVEHLQSGHSHPVE
ncbi:uncharacterized protein LOC135704269 [Ochlerotatus camptorhynchus]|uniref:uncharacterized protein LOC135704269 n=1 Tax=Ochlerotatus camptorhynchus TaxID=644619 RepID=UPI0031D0E0D0